MNIVRALVVVSLLAGCSKDVATAGQTTGKQGEPKSAATTESLSALPSAVGVQGSAVPAASINLPSTGATPAVGSASVPTTPTTGNAPGTRADYDLYVLALTWGPNFCCEKKDKEQCRNLAQSFASNHLTIHGLWPNFSDEQVAEHKKQGEKETYPQFCAPYDTCGKSDASSCDADPKSIPTEMKDYGPGFVTDNYFLANHEWPKHGSCTGLDSATYFQESIKEMLELPGDRGTPKLLSDNVGKKVKATELRAAFEQPESVVLSCDKSCNLSQVGICIASGKDGIPGARVACPKNVVNAEYDNGCFVKNRCPNVTIQAAEQCTKSTGNKCTNPGQGPVCSDDTACKGQGFLRCARSGCCTNVPK